MKIKMYLEVESSGTEVLCGLLPVPDGGGGAHRGARTGAGESHRCVAQRGKLRLAHRCCRAPRQRRRRSRARRKRRNLRRGGAAATRRGGRGGGAALVVSTRCVEIQLPHSRPQRGDVRAPCPPYGRVVLEEFGIRAARRRAPRTQGAWHHNVRRAVSHVGRVNAPRPLITTRKLSAAATAAAVIASTNAAADNSASLRSDVAILWSAIAVPQLPFARRLLARSGAARHCVCSVGRGARTRDLTRPSSRIARRQRSSAVVRLLRGPKLIWGGV